MACRSGAPGPAPAPPLPATPPMPAAASSSLADPCEDDRARLTLRGAPRSKVMGDWARQGARDASPESLPLADPPPLASHDPRPSHAIRHFDEGLDESASHSGFSDLLENYSMNVLPNYCRFKLRKGIASNKLIVGASCSVPAFSSTGRRGAPVYSLMVKPVDRSKWWNRWWHKAEVTARSVNVRSAKFTVLKYFRLQMELGFGRGIRSPLRWRVDTIWNHPRRMLNKQCLALYQGKNTSAEVRPHFDIDLSLPQAEGGAVLDDDDVDSMAGVDIGKCHVTMPLLEFVYKF
eukprot:jgi/Tetstr1/430472/TSEL_020280.t1